jgi:hypothetical protein
MSWPLWLEPNQQRAMVMLVPSQHVVFAAVSLLFGGMRDLRSPHAAPAYVNCSPRHRDADHIAVRESVNADIRL